MLFETTKKTNGLCSCKRIGKLYDGLCALCCKEECDDPREGLPIIEISRKGIKRTESMLH